MKLSEKLWNDNESGDFGNALEGYHEKAKKLEDAAYDGWLKEAVSWGASNDVAVKYANKRMSEI